MLPEIKTILQAGNQYYFGLAKLLLSRALSKNSKVQLYYTLLWPIVIYSCETWTLRKSEEYKQQTFERKILK